MPDGTQTYDYAKDPAFLNAPTAQQHAYLMENEPGYAKSDQKTQNDYLSHLRETAQPVAPTPKPPILTRPAMPGVASRYAGPQSVALTPEQRTSRDLPLKVEQEPFRRMGQGGAEVVHGQIAKGAHDVLTGAGEAALPLLPVSAAAAPVATALALLGGTAGSMAGKYGGEAIGLTSDQSDLAGDITGLAAGYGAGKTAKPLTAFARRFSAEVPKTWKVPGLPIRFGYQAPEPGTGAPLPNANEFYEQKAQDLMRRGREQAVLDRQAGRSTPPASPLSGLPSSAPSDVLALPERAAPLTVSGKPVASPITSSGANAEFVREIPKPKTQPSKIQLPGSEGPGYKVTYQSYPADQLVEMAKKGDVQAARELIRNPRGIDLSQIPNLRYLLEPGASRVPWRNLRK